MHSTCRHHRLEVLLDELARVLDGLRPDPMVPDVVVVAAAAQATWIEQQLALRLGVCANIQVRGAVTTDSAWADERLRWAVLAEIPALPDEPVFAQLLAYLDPRHGTRRRVLLAGQIASVVAKGVECGRVTWGCAWLAALVGRLERRLGPAAPGLALPTAGRVALFCPTLALLRRVPAEQAAHVFHLTLPSWDHPLAAGKGTALREVDHLLGAATWAVADERDTSLHQLQSDLCRGLQSSFARRPADRSLTIHDCHGETRQLEVLRDEILRRLQADDTLQPRDILVLCADLRALAPRIDHVFGQGGPALGFPKLPFDLADRSERAENPVAEALLLVLDLAKQRMQASTILDLLAIDPVRRRFGLEEAQLAELRGWIEQAGIRWGRDEVHREREHRPRAPDFTWRQGLDRLLAGLAIGLAEPWSGVLPVEDVEGSKVGPVYALIACVEALIPLLEALESDAVAPGLAWKVRCEAILDAMLRPAGAHRWQEVRVRQELAALADGLESSRILLDRDGFRAALGERFEGLARAGRFGGGGITFAQLTPHRVVPHRVVALVGMDIDGFPRRPLVPEFDPGDDPPRERDRLAFLLSLLAARDALIVTWSGHDVRSNAPHPPSVLISELIDVVGDGFVVAHPLHAWSPEAFTCDPPSLDRVAWAAAAASQRPLESPVFWRGSLPAEPLVELSLRDLVAFLKCPARYLLERRLKVFLSDESEATVDDDPERLSALEAWGVRDAFLAAEMRGLEGAAARERARLAGLLPLGVEGDTTAEDEQASALDIAERSRALAGVGPIGSALVEGLVDGVMVRGPLGGLVPGGRVVASASKVSAKYQLDLWVHHLAACAFHSPFGGASWLVGLDGTLQLKSVPAVEAERLLADLVALYRDGLTRPLAFTADEWSAPYLTLAFGEAPSPDPVLVQRIQGPLDEWMVTS
jgi:exodeoxyribonuclease V gamma subunit